MTVTYTQSLEKQLADLHELVIQMRCQYEVFVPQWIPELCDNRRFYYQNMCMRYATVRKISKHDASLKRIDVSADWVWFVSLQGIRSTKEDCHNTLEEAKVWAEQQVYDKYVNKGKFDVNA
jgi:hypothetical protein